MAVPDIASGEALKADDDARHHAWLGSHGIFPARFVGLRRDCGAGISQLPRVEVSKNIEGTAIQNLEAHQV